MVEDRDGRMATSPTRPMKVRVHHGLHPSGATLSESVRCADVSVALRHVLSSFAVSAAPISARIEAAVGYINRAVLYRLACDQVLVVGDGTVAAAVRGCLPCQGWRHCALPAPGTPLTSLSELVDLRTFNMLAREGFTCVEQVSALPDVVLLDIRGFGNLTVRRLRQAVASVLRPRYADDAKVVLEAPQLRELHDLLVMLTEYGRSSKEHDLVGRAETMIETLQRSEA